MPASPRARAAAKRMGVDIASVQPQPGARRIVEADVLKQKPAPVAAPQRTVVATRMEESFRAPHFYLHADANVEATVRTENGRRVYVASTTIEVHGDIQRPYAFSVSGRSSLGYTYFEQSISFVREILDVLRRSPF